jgi:hypothetical protein
MPASGFARKVRFETKKRCRPSARVAREVLSYEQEGASWHQEGAFYGQESGSRRRMRASS